MSQKSPGSGSGSRNLREGLRLLEWLSRCPEGAGVREAAAALGLTHSSAHRFLETMRVAGWVTQSPTTRKYELGPLAVRVGISALARMDLRKVANRALREIAERTGETAYLGVLIGAQVVYVDIVPGARTIGIYRPVGWMYWAFRTAVGKVLLADLPPDRLRELLPEGRLPRTGARGCVSLAPPGSPAPRRTGRREDEGGWEGFVSGRWTGARWRLTGPRSRTCGTSVSGWKSRVSCG